MTRARTITTLLLLATVLAGGVGCSVSRPAPTAAANSAPAGELTPVQAWNNYLGILAEGDEAAIRACIYVHPGEKEKARLERSVAVISSTARLRKAFDEAYGSGRLVKLGFHCALPEARLPADSSFEIQGDHATVTARGWDTIRLVKSGGAWKEDFIPYEILTAEKKDPQSLPLDRLLLNLTAVNEVLKRTLAEVKAGAYLSAADAFGALNARFHGNAGQLPPMGVAYTIDLTAPGVAAEKHAPNTARVIELRGDGARLGQAQGAELGDVIRELSHEYFSHAFDLASEGGRSNYERALRAAAGFEKFVRPEHLEEIRALAASTRLEPAEVMLGQCFPDLNPGGACSTIALPASASADGVARFGRNLDYQTFGLLEKHSVILMFHPRDRYAFASIAAPGLIGVLSGMNEHGLSLAVMEVPRSLRAPAGMPFMLLYRTVLENCKTVEEAITLLRQTARQSSNNLMLMDASGDRAVAELTPGKVTVRRAPPTAALVSTNHQRGGDLDSPDRCNRFDFLHDASSRQFGRLSEASVEEMLAGAAQGDFTFQSMVFEPSTRILYLALGAGAPNHGFARLDLNPLFH